MKRREATSDPLVTATQGKERKIPFESIQADPVGFLQEAPLGSCQESPALLVQPAAPSSPCQTGDSIIHGLLYGM